VANTATITDTLPEIIDSAWSDIVEVLQRYFSDYPEEDCPDWSDLDRDGSLHEIIDGSVPVYYVELDSLAYFHHREALAALDEQFGGISGDWPLGPFVAGLYCLIDEACRERFNDDAEDLWEDWQEESRRVVEERESPLTAEQRNPSLCK
jgi:hypothetical protein